MNLVVKQEDDGDNDTSTLSTNPEQSATEVTQKQEKRLSTDDETPSAELKMTTMSANLFITPFTPGESQWERWLQRTEGALAIMKITDTTEKARYLLLYIGETAYNALCDNFGNANVGTKEYDDLTAKLKELYAPAALEISENYKFNCRKQMDGESVQNFATALNKLSANCGFGDFL